MAEARGFHGASAMTPAEVMAKAAYERPNGTHRHESFAALKELCPEVAGIWVEDMRAALRALATMPPTEAMDSACQDEMDNEDLHCAWDVARAGILVAAEEGEQPHPALSEGGTRQEDAGQ